MNYNPELARFEGDVEIDCGEHQLFGSEMEFFIEQGKIIGKGNVVFSSGTSRISADRMEFDTRTKTGTFYNASGNATLADPKLVARSQFGTQESDVYFYGETIEKLGSRRYRITKGGFTTCVQPTPRWIITSESVTLDLDHYAILRDSIFRVKGVPLFYLPVLYYPLQEDDRATGILLPQYGSSAVRGQQISNAFFWAMSRSADATFFHDWFSKSGQGMGSEARYIAERGEGNGRFYHLRERPTSTRTRPGGPVTTTPGKRAYDFRGGFGQALPLGLRARGRADYFSDITIQQTYFTNIYDASRRQRSYAANLSGNWRGYSFNGTYNREETFFGLQSSTLTGSAPRFNFSQAERPLGGLPIYFSFNADYATILRNSVETKKDKDNVDVTTALETGLDRRDFQTTIRFPFTQLRFLTVNSSLAWRYTTWSESRMPDPANPDRFPDRFLQVEVPVRRRFADVQTRIVGPVFQKIFNTPDNAFADKYKHVVEPFVNIQRVTPIDGFRRIPQLDAEDSIVGNTTRVSYGVTNRVFAKLRAGPNAGNAREVVSLNVTQTYYSDARASQFDRQFGTSFTGTQPAKLSPVSLNLRFSPNEVTGGNLNAEYDTKFMALRTVGANGTYAYKERIYQVAGWSQRRFIKGLSGFDDRNSLEHYLNSATTFQFRDNEFGGIYLFNYDLTKNAFLQQRIVGYYNAQCCGITAEFQVVGTSRVKDKRFNVAFSLAGIGTFSNLLGALSGAPGQPGQVPFSPFSR
ncbi:MAG: LPS-assembly protein LptD [Acidobacteria bacterium]|nr:LPS-assembly protein LptD [Acidobacteriota bacterium]